MAKTRIVKNQLKSQAVIKSVNKNNQKANKMSSNKAKNERFQKGINLSKIESSFRKDV